MKKACLVLIASALSIAPAFAGVTMVTQTTTSSSKCDFRVDKCQTEVATDPSYIHFHDGSSHLGPNDVGAYNGDPTRCGARYGFADYASNHVATIDELLADIRAKLNKCPDVTLAFDEDSGDLTLHYLKTDCDCDCDFTINIRDIQATDFVWTRTHDNYSPRLGQMERRKFHTVSEQDAQDIQSDFGHIRAINNWSVTPVTTVVVQQVQQ